MARDLQGAPVRHFVKVAARLRRERGLVQQAARVVVEDSTHHTRNHWGSLTGPACQRVVHKVACPVVAQQQTRREICDETPEALVQVEAQCLDRNTNRDQGHIPD